MVSLAALAQELLRRLGNPAFSGGRHSLEAGITTRVFAIAEIRAESVKLARLVIERRGRRDRQERSERNDCAADDAIHAAARSSGKLKVNVEPLPGSLSRRISPPCSSTRRRVSVSP